MSPQIQTLPHLAVEIDGTPLALEDARTLWGVRVQQRLSMPTLCELTFLEPADGISKGELFSSGRSIRVKVAASGELLFNGEVTATEHIYEASRGREVRVRGYDVLHRLRKRQPVPGGPLLR